MPLITPNKFQTAAEQKAREPKLLLIEKNAEESADQRNEQYGQDGTV